MKKLRVLAVGTNSDHMLRHIRFCDEMKDKDVQVDMFLTVVNEPVSVFHRENAFGTSMPKVFSPLLHLPRISDVVRRFFQVSSFRKIMRNNDYHLVCIHQLHPYTLAITKISKKHGSHVMLCPWGSDVLRASEKNIRKLKKAFALADFVSSDLSFGFTDKYVQMYDVSRYKLVEGGYGSEVISSVYEQKPIIDKNCVAVEFGMPKDRFYITCGYAATRSQRHLNMIEAVGKNKEIIPRPPFLIFPFTYGPDRFNDYQNELVSLCKQYHLEYCFVKDYMPIDKVARLRLLSDLYFHILPTDVCSSSLLEYLLAGSICVNGKWLDYPSLEKYQVPYYICDSLAVLPDVLNMILIKPDPHITLTKETEQVILAGNNEARIRKWYDFYHYYINTIKERE